MTIYKLCSCTCDVHMHVSACSYKVECTKTLTVENYDKFEE